MALEPITRQEKIIAGQDLTPITRMEKFLKDFGGGGGESDFNVNVVDTSPDEQGVVYLTLDATNEQIGTAYESGKRVFINMLGLANAQVQKSPNGRLYAIVFVPKTTGSSGLTKLAVYYLEDAKPNWRMGITYISTTTE